MAQRQLSERARKFLREVGSIVLGVLIALGIGEVADDLRWRAKAADSERAMNTELAQAAGVLDERVLVQPCLSRRLDTLDQLLREARKTGTLPDIPFVGKPPLRPLSTAAWDDAVAGGVLPHLAASLRSKLGLDYPLLKKYPENVAQESLSWASLHIIEGVPGPVSDTVLAEASSTIAKLRWGSDIMGLTAQQLRDDIVARGIRPDYEVILDRPGNREEIVSLMRSRPVCQPLQLG